MGKKFDIFYFSSTHWDREWYQTFQGFRFRLVKLVDNLLSLLEKDSEYKTFHFDGQTIVLEDYLEIEPEKKEKLQEMIKSGRILIGPWYVMPDEFLVSGESLIRNLMIGHEISKDWGVKPWKYGYVCDCFGHIAQLPQILNGFDIKYSLLGRGTREDDPTYFLWQSPDGSEVINYKLPPNEGYGSFKTEVYRGEGLLDVDDPEMVLRIKKYIDAELERSEFPVGVLMDGMDHSEAYTKTTELIKKIEELYPEATVHHVNLCEQGKLLENYRDKLPVISGELNKTAMDRHGYLHLITNTLSSYYPIKQANDRCQNMLEKVVEPIGVLSQMSGQSIKRGFVKEAYKKLIQNHPHDSICGCSIDRVHKDMEYRFSQTEEICKTLTEDYLHKTARHNETSNNYESVLTVFNMLPYEVEKTITADLDFPQDYSAKYQEPFGYELINSFRIYDAENNEIPYSIKEIKRGWVKRIFDQVVRVCDVHTVTFKATIPGCSMAEFKIVPEEKSPVRYLEKLKAGQNYAENDYLRFDILNNGSLKITDKVTGKVYSDLCNLSDDGEIGDGWFHANPVNDIVVNSSVCSASVEKIEHGPSRCVFRVTRYMELPECVEQDKFGKHRSETRVKVKFSMLVGLSEESRYVDFSLDFDNTVKDHRLKLLLPTGITTDTYFSGQAFCCCERKVGIDYTTQNWRETDQYEKSTNGIFGKRDADGFGLAFIAAEGIHECAAYDDEEGTVAATLLRSFKTTVMTNGEEKCQLQKNLNYKFYIVPLDNDVSYSDLLKLQDIQGTNMPVYFENVQADDIKVHKSPISVDGKNVSVSVIKVPESGEDDAFIIRVFNSSGEDAEGKITVNRGLLKAEETNLNEELIADVETDGNSVKFGLSPWKIKTFKIYYKK